MAKKGTFGTSAGARFFIIKKTYSKFPTSISVKGRFSRKIGQQDDEFVLSNIPEVAVHLQSNFSLSINFLI